MRRRPSTRVAPISAEQPLAERVDRAGVRQRTDPGEARESREAGRAADDEQPGWWYFDGEEWTYHGAGELPA